MWDEISHHLLSIYCGPGLTPNNHQGTLTYDYDYDLTSLPMWWVVKTLNKVFIMVVAENLLMFWVTGLNIQESRGI